MSGLSGTPTDLLTAAAREFGTPCYVYDVDLILRRFAKLMDLFRGRFGVSYAVKCNPNVALLKAILPFVTTLDVSSFAEAQRATSAGGLTPLK